jgi:hypothetical protein
MEIAQGHHPGNKVEARAEADQMLCDGLSVISAAAEILHDQEPTGYPDRILERTSRLLGQVVAAAIGLGLLVQPDTLLQLAA